MAPPPRPSPIDNFFARYQNPILMGTFAAQVGHYQYIRHTSPAFEAVSSSIKAPAIPRTLRAGLGWAVGFIGLLTKITLAKKTVRDYSDPVVALSSQRKDWRRPAKEGFLYHDPAVTSHSPPTKNIRTMSADFWAGYISGAAGILIGNPLDLIKVRLQAGTPSLTAAPTSYTSQFSSAGSLIRGATAPILGYGALNALLFVTYNRTSALLNSSTTGAPPSLWTTWLAGAIGGLATWVVSTPTELVKCRAQISSSPTAASSWGITKEILRSEGVRGLYFGGAVTALRDSIGYGFYFWSYELSTRLMMTKMRERGSDSQEAAKVLLCGGLAGVVTWASIFPLDVIKTRVQTQILADSATVPLLGPAVCTDGTDRRRLRAVEVARNAYRTEGPGVFFKGLTVCSIRAFIVNAAQWAVYEWIMNELDPKRKISRTKDGRL